jgi:putative lipase involved disintegration of autophagic bodies
MKKILYIITISLVTSILITSCASPQKVDIKLKETKVSAKKDTYSASLDIFGKMTEIFASKKQKYKVKGS